MRFSCVCVCFFFFFRPQSSQKQESQTALKRRLEKTPVPEFPRHRLRMLSKLSEGNYGAVSRIHVHNYTFDSVN